MDKFLTIQQTLSKKYKKYDPLFCYLNTSYGLIMAMKLNKLWLETENINRLGRHGKIEIIIHEQDELNQIIEKINVNIVFQKNKLKTNYCRCGFSLSRFTGVVNCCECKKDTCMVCYFRIFKQQYGEYICYNCATISGKKISNKKIFDMYFKDCYNKYIEEMNDEKLKQIEL